MDKNRIEGAAMELGGKVQGAFGDAVNSDRDSVQGRVREAEGVARNLYGQASDTLREAGTEASRYASHLYEDAGEYARDGSRIVRRQVRENPVSALFVAGILGFLLGLIARDRH
ncbi:CsbD family protein [Aureimonas pseudogalii]|uniref:Uncharacterized protein YjbJ (UPF0337 family) n=1 Tax=Aureimonas pseudogalii TaxID=1744844 RepID=A0A7W6EFM9_9HYPH|nr:CsbD family protein [Aureimonas pseudogalii]MBB3997785.1 uncharacterized protein YjbJ (UPF0337 family) [Aureimonas pseudogalii]